MSKQNKIKNFLICDMELLDKTENLLATVLYHRLFYLWVIDKQRKVNGGYCMVSFRELSKVFHTSPQTIMRTVNLLVDKKLLEYKAEERSTSYIKFNIDDEEIIPYLKKYNLYKDMGR